MSTITEIAQNLRALQAGGLSTPKQTGESPDPRPEDKVNKSDSTKPHGATSLK